MMKVIDIDDYIFHIKQMAITQSYLKMYHIEEARALHKKHSAAEIQQIIEEAKKMNGIEISGLIAVGLRQPALREVGRMMIQRELKKRELIKG